MVSTARSGRSAFLRSVSSVDSDLFVTLSSDKIPGGSGLYVYAFPATGARLVRITVVCCGSVLMVRWVCGSIVRRR